MVRSHQRTVPYSVLLQIGAMLRAEKAVVLLLLVCCLRCGAGIK